MRLFYIKHKLIKRADIHKKCKIKFMLSFFDKQGFIIYGK